MRNGRIILAFILLICSVMPALAGEISATFGFRLSCPYSSFVIGKVKKIQQNSVEVAVTRGLLRKSSKEIFQFNFSSKAEQYKVGESLLINCLDFPPAKKLSWLSFPNSYYRGRRHEYFAIAHIRKDGKLDINRTYRSNCLDGLINWLYSTNNWKVRILNSKPYKRTGMEYEIAFPDGHKKKMIFPYRSGSR